MKKQFMKLVEGGGGQYFLTQETPSADGNYAQCQ